MKIEHPRRERQKQRDERFISHVSGHSQHAQDATFVTRHHALDQDEEARKLRQEALRPVNFAEPKQAGTENQNEPANVVESAVEGGRNDFHGPILAP